MAFARQQVLTPQSIDLPVMFREAKALIAHAIGGNIKLRVKASADIWQPQADSTQLQSALLNLAVNAGDAMPEGERSAFMLKTGPLRVPITLWRWPALMPLRSSSRTRVRA